MITCVNHYSLSIVRLCCYLFIQPCPSGSNSGIAGASVCPLCDPGKYQPSEGSFSCFNCPANTYLTTTGATSQIDCLACPSQTPYSLPASTTPQACSPVPCASGWYASSNSSTCDAPCPQGFYCLNAQSFPCLPGTYATTIGSTSCSLCNPGSYSLVLGATNSSSCTDCPAGTFGIYTGQAPTSCLSCPPGSANNRTGSSLSSDCIACPPGTASSFAGTVTCPLCPVGTYQPDQGQASCLACREGSYQGELGMADSSSCTDCPAGTRSPAGSGSVSSCVALVCPSGRFGSDCSMRCPPGSFCNGPSTSQLCRPGSYSDQDGSAICALCPAGRYSTESGATSDRSCLDCVAGTWSNTTGASSCSMCPYGTASSTTGSTTIQDCRTCGSNASTVCIGAVPLRITVSDLMPAAAALLQQQSSRTTFASAQQPARESVSLREAAFGVDPFESQAASVSASDPAASSISNAAIAICISLLVVCAALPLLVYRRIPSVVARRLDQFALHHHVADGAAPLKRPTKWGSAISWSFIPIAVLVGVVLGSSSNALVSKTLLPASSSSRNAHGCIQLTLRAYGDRSSSSTDSTFCTSSNSTDPRTLPLAAGFSSSPRVRTLLSDTSCSLSINCADCSLQGVGNWSVVLPWSYQLIEFEVWITGAEVGASSRLYGILAPMASTQVLDEHAELQFSLLQAFYVDARHTASASVPSESDVSSTGEVDPSLLYTSQSGFEVAYQFYQTVRVQDSASLTSSSTTTLSFIFNPSDIIYQTTVTEKTSRAQLLFSILASVVSLFSLFSIVFKLTERIMSRLGISTVDATLQAIYLENKITSSKTMVDVTSGDCDVLEPSPLAAIQLQEISRSPAVVPDNMIHPPILDTAHIRSDDVAL